MARNRSAARLVRLAAMLTRKSQAEARYLQASLGGNAGLAALEPDPAKAGIPVDDKPNPFQDGTDDPDACLRGPWLDNVVPMRAHRARFSAADLVSTCSRRSARPAPRIPGLIVARDDLSARRLLDRVRGSGSASPA